MHCSTFRTSLFATMLCCSWLAAVDGDVKVDGIGFIDAASTGFLPEADGMTNAKALQRAVDHGGTVVVERPGTYRLAGTVYLSSDTTLRFGPKVVVQKVAEAGPFSHVLLNRGAITKTWDQHITVEGLTLAVNGVDVRAFKEAYGLHGQVAFFYARDVAVRHFRCLDLGPAQYGIQVCTFEDLAVEDVIIKGKKDGVHLGRGRRFHIRDGLFDTFDDAIALNGHDYATGNPELGWIEDGVVENCQDLPADHTTGYFCRILAGAWSDWRDGMTVQQSDTVIADGRLYRVQAKPDGTLYTSHTKPSHVNGTVVLDDIPWGVVQQDATPTAGVRNVVFRDIILRKARTAFSIHFDNGKYSRSYYPGAPIPLQENLLFDHIQDLVPASSTNSVLFNLATPVDAVSIINSRIGNRRIQVTSNSPVADYGPTSISMVNCTFTYDQPLDLVVNRVPRKQIRVVTHGSTVLNPGFTARMVPGDGTIQAQGDLITGK